MSQDDDALLAQVKACITHTLGTICLPGYREDGIAVDDLLLYPAKQFVCACLPATGIEYCVSVVLSDTYEDIFR